MGYERGETLLKYVQNFCVRAGFLGACRAIGLEPSLVPCQDHHLRRQVSNVLQKGLFFCGHSTGVVMCLYVKNCITGSPHVPANTFLEEQDRETGITRCTGSRSFSRGWSFRVS